MFNSSGNRDEVEIFSRTGGTISSDYETRSMPCLLASTGPVLLVFRRVIADAMTIFVTRESDKL